VLVERTMHGRRILSPLSATCLIFFTYVRLSLVVFLVCVCICIHLHKCIVMQHVLAFSHRLTQNSNTASTGKEDSMSLFKT